MALLLTLFAIPTIFTSCGDDKDEPDNSAYYDFSIVWDVVDKGVYSTADAQALAASFTYLTEDVFEAYTTDAAIREFNNFCQQFRYEFATNYNEITLRANLVRNEGNVKVASKTFYIKPTGTTLGAPAKYGKTIKNEVIVQ